MIQAGIAGGAGYTAGELIRILVNHPHVELNFVYSTSNAGNLLSDVHQDLLGSTEIRFSDTINTEVDVLFLCLGHGTSKRFLEENHFTEKTVIIDLSNDFRLKADTEFQGREFIYGLTELNRDKIKQACSIANPGCFATAIQLALLPLAENKLISDAVHITGVTGATGAGTSLSDTTHYTWRDNNFSYYKAFTHQHLGEIYQTLSSLQRNFDQKVHFLPHRGNFSRGIFVTAYTKYDGSLEDAKALYSDFYKDAPFTFVSEKELHLKQVVNTNKCFLHVHKEDGMLLITSIIDNLTKGASGQAVENMNLIFGLPQTEGLNLKANFF
ncbi:N-acetyl-gamma-glutamyl-phosphate reductase [Flavimarina sp. Hel_I_48]|uniref:N-acetyl-gamma-glutamyl-phosphate reductase n=1 Tax=Flavimarina sp. Hel_I_48 TaxID=1392488 RepID=UPI0004DF6FDC|nr:N-acetyl-gamma-glutamyl-phosphate reductase [Flavimarina sp. Hel_I_48]